MIASARKQIDDFGKPDHGESITRKNRTTCRQINPSVVGGRLVSPTWAISYRKIRNIDKLQDR